LNDEKDGENQKKHTNLGSFGFWNRGKERADLSQQLPEFTSISASSNQHRSASDASNRNLTFLWPTVPQDRIWLVLSPLDRNPLKFKVSDYLNLVKVTRPEIPTFRDDLAIQSDGFWGVSFGNLRD